MTKEAFRKAFSFPVLLAVLLAGVTWLASCYGLADPDLFVHLAVGRDILATGRWPTTDSYSFTAYGNGSLAYEWVGQVAMALALRAGGLRGLAALLAALSATLIMLLYFYAWTRCGNAKAAFVACLMALPLAFSFFHLRPQLLGYCFFVLTLIRLERFRQGRRRALWPLPAVFLVWVNTHGTFVFGLFALGLYWAAGLVDLHRGGLKSTRWTAQQRRQLEFTGLLCLVALTITPYGTRLAAFPLEYALQSQLGFTYISEYLPLGGIALKLTLLLLLLFLLAQVALRPTYRPEEMGLLLFALCGALLHLRLLLLFALVFTPLLAMLLARWIPNYQAARDRPVLNVAMMVLVVAVSLGFVPSREELARDFSGVYPQRAVEYLHRHPVSGRMLNSDNWGGYLIWTLGPNMKVFIDTRSQLYEAGGVLGDYLRIAKPDRDVTSLLTTYGIDACLIEPTARLATLLAAVPGWQRVYQDDVAVLFLRKEGARVPSGTKGRSHITAEKIVQ